MVVPSLRVPIQSLFAPIITSVASIGWAVLCGGEAVTLECILYECTQYNSIETDPKSCARRGSGLVWSPQLDLDAARMLEGRRGEFHCSYNLYTPPPPLKLRGILNKERSLPASWGWCASLSSTSSCQGLATCWQYRRSWWPFPGWCLKPIKQT